MLEVFLKYAKDLSMDLEAKDGMGRTPMHYMFQSRLKQEVLQFIEVARNEYSIEFDLNVTDHEGKTPIQMSIEF